MNKLDIVFFILNVIEYLCIGALFVLLGVGFIEWLLV